MISRLLPVPILGVLSLTIFILNTIFWCLLIYALVPLRLLASPFPSFLKVVRGAMIWCAENWISCNNWEMRWFTAAKWDIRGVENLDMNHSYLVCCNHQTWVDIVVLQKAFNRVIPFLRFFLKKQLIYVPMLGWAWWALDFPFMQRYSRSYLKRHPEKRGRDLETTRKACERFQGSTISILNFLEGTRFSEAKRLKSESPFTHLLPPKTGGLAFTIDAMGRQFRSLINVTIFYPGGAKTFWDLICGRVKEVVVRIEEIPIPQELLAGNYQADEYFRARLQAWVRSIWDRKDLLLTELAKKHAESGNG